MPINQPQASVADLLALIREFQTQVSSASSKQVSGAKLEAFLQSLSDVAKSLATPDEQVQRLKAIMDVVNDPIFVKDSEHRIVHANRAFCVIFGLDPIELLGKTLAENVPENERSEFLKVDRQVLATGIPDEREETLTTAGKATRNIITRKARFIDQSGRPFLVGSIHDITDVRQSSLKFLDSQRFLSTVLDALPVAVFAKDIQQDLQWTVWNKQAEELFGLKAEDCLGKTDKDLFPKEQADFFRTKDLETISTPGVMDIPEEPADTPKGPVTLRTRKVVIREANGTPQTLLGITQDISQEKRWLAEQQESRARSIKDAERFRALFDASPVPILVFSDRGVLDCNLAAIKILAAPNKTAILASHPAKFSPELQADGQRSSEKSLEMDRLARSNGTHRFEWLHQTFEGTVFPVEVTLSLIEWSDEQALLVLWNDLTELKRQQQKLLQASRMASLGEMSAGIAHEINNPLAIISGSVGLLSKYADNPEKLSSKIQAIQKSCERISRIVTGLKKFSRSNEKTTFQKHELNKILQEASMLTEAKSKRHSTPVTIDCKSHAHILCDDIEIEQVLVNLINNAIDAVKHTSEKWVNIELHDDAESVVLRITDSGHGIPEQLRNKIFEPFFSTKKVGEGTGLGLSITKGIIDEHQATIAIVADAPNTCFELRFQRCD
jgi:PAS domain S-box-containing protein